MNVFVPQKPLGVYPTSVFSGMVWLPSWNSTQTSKPLGFHSSHRYLGECNVYCNKPLSLSPFDSRSSFCRFIYQTTGLIIYTVLTEMDDKQYPRNWKQTELPRSSTPFSGDLKAGRTKHNVKLKSLARVNKNRASQTSGFKGFFFKGFWIKHNTCFCSFWEELQLQTDKILCLIEQQNVLP